MQRRPQKQYRLSAAPIPLCHSGGGAEEDVGLGKVFLVCFSFSLLQPISNKQ